MSDTNGVDFEGDSYIYLSTSNQGLRTAQQGIGSTNDERLL